MRVDAGEQEPNQIEKSLKRRTVEFLLSTIMGFAGGLILGLSLIAVLNR